MSSINGTNDPNHPIDRPWVRKTKYGSDLLGNRTVRLFCFEKGQNEYGIKPAIVMENPSKKDVEKAQNSLANLVNNVAFKVIHGSAKLPEKRAFIEGEMQRISSFNEQLGNKIDLLHSNIDIRSPSYPLNQPHQEYFNKLILLSKQVKSNNTTIRIFQNAKQFNRGDIKETLPKLNRSLDKELKKSFTFVIKKFVPLLERSLGRQIESGYKLEIDSNMNKAIKFLKEFSSVLKGQDKADLDTKISELNYHLNSITKRK